jgi:hypothetical protein
MRAYSRLAKSFSGWGSSLPRFCSFSLSLFISHKSPIWPKRFFGFFASLPTKTIYWALVLVHKGKKRPKEESTRKQLIGFDHEWSQASILSSFSVGSGAYSFLLVYALLWQLVNSSGLLLAAELSQSRW